MDLLYNTTAPPSKFVFKQFGLDILDLLVEKRLAVYREFEQNAKSHQPLNYQLLTQKFPIARRDHYGDDLVCHWFMRVLCRLMPEFQETFMSHEAQIITLRIQSDARISAEVMGEFLTHAVPNPDANSKQSPKCLRRDVMMYKIPMEKCTWLWRKRLRRLVGGECLCYLEDVQRCYGEFFIESCRTWFSTKMPAIQDDRLQQILPRLAIHSIPRAPDIPSIGLHQIDLSKMPPCMRRLYDQLALHHRPLKHDGRKALVLFMLNLGVSPRDIDRMFDESLGHNKLYRYMGTSYAKHAYFPLSCESMCRYGLCAWQSFDIEDLLSQCDGDTYEDISNHHAIRNYKSCCALYGDIQTFSNTVNYYKQQTQK